MNPAHRRNLCQSFVNYLRDHPKGTLRIDFPDTWLSNAITSSGGAGNPTGSVITLDAQAVEPVRRSMLEGICRLASEATVSQAIFDSIFVNTLDKVVGAINAKSPATDFTFGRAQKLANIYLKTLYAAFWGEFRDTGENGRSLAWLGRWSGCLHIPVDRGTMKYFDQDPSKWCLTRIGSKLKSWKWDLDQATYQKLQALVRECAASGNYLDPMHLEMDQIWLAPSAGGTTMP